MLLQCSYLGVSQPKLFKLQLAGQVINYYKARLQLHLTYHFRYGEMQQFRSSLL